MLEHSTEINEIITALAKAQSKFPKIAFDSINPHFKSEYASLSSIIDKTKPLLCEFGLTLIQSPSTDENGKVTIVTMLAHQSGQWMKGSLDLKPDRVNVQGIGSAISYGRRYACKAMLNVADGKDDDDGNHAMPSPPTMKPKPKPADQKPLVDVNEVYNPDNENHKDVMRSLFRKYKVTEMENCKRFSTQLAESKTKIKDLDVRLKEIIENLVQEG